jgi:hypothetical protein
MEFTRIRQSHRTQELIQIGSRAHNLVTAAEREGNRTKCYKHLDVLAYLSHQITLVVIVVCVCVAAAACIREPGFTFRLICP